MCDRVHEMAEVCYR